jgi:hypothetical protein
MLSVFENKKLVKLGGSVETVVFLYILVKVVPDTVLSKCTKTSPEGMYKVSGFCVS